jgi:hypothetical protein
MPAQTPTVLNSEVQASILSSPACRIAERAAISTLVVLFGVPGTVPPLSDRALANRNDDAASYSAPNDADVKFVSDRLAVEVLPELEKFFWCLSAEAPGEGRRLALPPVPLAHWAPHGPPAGRSPSLDSAWFSGILVSEPVASQAQGVDERCGLLQAVRQQLDSKLLEES